MKNAVLASSLLCCEEFCEVIIMETFLNISGYKDKCCSHYLFEWLVSVSS